jgi:hypothetical protein
LGGNDCLQSSDSVATILYEVAHNLGSVITAQQFCLSCNIQRILYPAAPAQSVKHRSKQRASLFPKEFLTAKTDRFDTWPLSDKELC